MYTFRVCESHYFSMCHLTFLKSVYLSRKKKNTKKKYEREGNSEGRRKHREREDTDFTQYWRKFGVDTITHGNIIYVRITGQFIWCWGDCHPSTYIGLYRTVVMKTKCQWFPRPTSDHLPSLKFLDHWVKREFTANLLKVDPQTVDWRSGLVSPETRFFGPYNSWFSVLLTTNPMRLWQVLRVLSYLLSTVTCSKSFELQT